MDAPTEVRSAGAVCSEGDFASGYDTLAAASSAASHHARATARRGERHRVVVAGLREVSRTVEAAQ